MMTSQILKSVDFTKIQKPRYLENETFFFFFKKSLIEYKGLLTYYLLTYWLNIVKDCLRKQIHLTQPNSVEFKILAIFSISKAFDAAEIEIKSSRDMRNSYIW